MGLYIQRTGADSVGLFGVNYTPEVMGKFMTSM
jgi:hypothetical protein